MDLMDEQYVTKEKKHRRPSRRIARWIVIVVAIGLLLCVAVFLVQKSGVFESKATQLGFKDIGELATQSAIVTVVHATDEPRKIFGTAVPLTRSTFIYSYDMDIKAGFDFEKIEWTANDETKTISVVLPEAEVLSEEIVEGSFKQYYESNNIFNPLSMEMTDEALMQMMKEAKEKAIENGLLENARSNAEQILKPFFANAYDMSQYTLTFTHK